MTRQIKNSLYEQFSRTAKALSSPKRLEIVDLLSQGEKTVETIAVQADLGLKNASAQLKELRSARLVDSRKEGKHVYYRLADPDVSEFWLQLRAFSEKRFTEIQRITSDVFGNRDDLEGVNRKQLLSKARRGDVVLLDVRPQDEYSTAHLPFAISVPISEIKKHLSELPKDKEIVAYCRGPYCFLAKEAVEVLRKHGFKAIRLKDSVQDWESLGLPIEATEGATR